jgi:hypothetical protein
VSALSFIPAATLTRGILICATTRDRASARTCRSLASRERAFTYAQGLLVHDLAGGSEARALVPGLPKYSAVRSLRDTPQDGRLSEFTRHGQGRPIFLP